MEYNWVSSVIKLLTIQTERGYFIMALFERLSNTISAASKDGLNKAKEIKDTAKINVDIREREGSIQRMYRELGKAYYQDHKDDPAPEYSQVFAIKAAFEEIGELKTSKDEIRGIKRCATCGKVISMDALFCSGCGAKVEDDTVVFDGDDFKETAEDKADEIKEDMKEAAEDAAAKASGFAETGKEVAQDAAQEAREHIRDVADKAEDLAKDAAQKVEGVAKDIAHRVEEFIDKNAD